MSSTKNFIHRNLFKNAALYYARYRLPYPPKFFKVVKDDLCLNGGGRLLDLGCGTGQLAIPLAKYFEEVIAMDPDPEMLRVGKIQAKKVGVRNIKWVLGADRDVTTKMGIFHLVTMGSSFHWMNQPVLLRILDKVIDPRGGIVISTNVGVNVWNPHYPWQETVKSVIQKHLGEKRRAGSGYYNKEARFETVLRRSAFKKWKKLRIPQEITWDIRHILGYLYSTSFCSRRFLGNKIKAFEYDMKKNLLRINPIGKFKAKSFLEAMFVWRK